MPNFDGTGPQGKDPATGWKRGGCYGPGWRMHHHGRGLGRYCRCNQPQTDEEKKKALTDYVQALKEELEDTQKELNTFTKTA